MKIFYSCNSVNERGKMFLWCCTSFMLHAIRQQLVSGLSCTLKTFTFWTTTKSLTILICFLLFWWAFQDIHIPSSLYCSPRKLLEEVYMINVKHFMFLEPLFKSFIISTCVFFVISSVWSFLSSCLLFFLTSYQLVILLYL